MNNVNIVIVGGGGGGSGTPAPGNTYQYYGAKRIFDSNSIAIYNNTLNLDRHDPDLMTVVFQAINPFGDVT